ncbi:MAG: AAA family ATPase [Flavobacteriales bacterium]|nr:AAA family ATPase [Flavobacteriales bacterium]MCB9166155.1 AAA family ATPase [Flavobacteriales bacterium]
MDRYDRSSFPLLGSSPFTLKALSESLLDALGHAPTAGQSKAARALERLMASERSRPVLVVKGYAGTGKTSLVGALVQVLVREGRPVVLLAPTGRAAKVLSAYSGSPASTIHRRIYRMRDDGSALRSAVHRDEGALFIVDEASMIGNGNGGGEGPFGDRDLLSDLFDHVFSAPRCRLLLIGDPAQLPPVGSDESPALDVKGLHDHYALTAGAVELKEVVRQQAGSGILENATMLRHLLDVRTPMPRFLLGHKDVHRVDGTGLQDALETAFSRHGQEEVCVITRSNKRAYLYGQQVRARILGFEEELCPGDRLMVVRNDYFWAARNGKPELIANGEQVEVLRVGALEERYGSRFCSVDIAWSSSEERREGEVMIMLDVIGSEAPALPFAQRRRLQEAILATTAHRSHAARTNALRQDPFANALQVKYAYAVTCHKAQGGQWRSVFVDQGYVTEDMIDREYMRWLYTAITRASENLFLLNFHPRFFGEDERGST